MKRIYLIRHGEPAFPGGKRMCLGSTDLPLSENGILQAESAARFLDGKNISLYTSPMLRAIQTAEAFKRPVTVLEDLRELYAGQWDGLTFDEIKIRFPELYAARGRDKTIPLPGAESNEQGLHRFERALYKAVSSVSEDLAIVGHGGIMALFLEKHLGSWEKPGYGEVITLIYNHGIFRKPEDEDHA